MIHVAIMVGILITIGATITAFLTIEFPMPPPPQGSWAEYLTDLERLGVQSNEDFKIAKEIARKRGWSYEPSASSTVED